jgi:hypothetical protein
MNPSEEITEMAELHLPLGDHCFVYVDEELTIQMSIKSIDPVALVSTFVSYMKAVGFDPEAIKSALHTKAISMKASSSILTSEE